MPEAIVTRAFLFSPDGFTRQYPQPGTVIKVPDGIIAGLIEQGYVTLPGTIPKQSKPQDRKAG